MRTDRQRDGHEANSRFCNFANEPKSVAVLRDNCDGQRLKGLC